VGRVTQQKAHGAGSAWSWVELHGLSLLVGLCVMGAFLGAGRARALFNSTPLAYLWATIGFLLAVRIVRALVCGDPPALILGVVGALCVLTGSMCNSEAGHRFLGGEKPGIYAGRMLVPETQPSGLVLDDEMDRRLGDLPFELRLDEIRQVPSAGGGTRTIAVVGVLEDGRERRRFAVGPNRPMRYGGYRIALREADVPGQRWALFAVRSATGMGLVYVGFALLVVGVVWACWLDPARTQSRRRPA